jgi:hypothetical protein
MTPGGDNRLRSGKSNLERMVEQVGSAGSPAQPDRTVGTLVPQVLERALLGVVRILFETHKLDVDHVETFVGLGDKFPQQVVHKNAFSDGLRARPPLSVGSAASVSMKRLILVARYRAGRCD